MKKGFIILLVIPLVFACSDIENCGADQNIRYMIVRFFDLETEVAKKVGFTIGSGLVTYGEGFFSTDSTIVFLPLNPNEDAASFFFISDTSNHQLEVNYSTEFSIFDPDCDPSINFNNIDTVQQTFDSTVVVSPITNIFTTNIEIYF